MAPRLSVIVPVLDEAPRIAGTLMPLQALRAAGHEVIVVDGGSADDTVGLARPLADHMIGSPRGRARQMNAGAARARGEVLLFLHADTTAPPCLAELVLSALAEGRHWGRFDVRIQGRHPLLRVVGSLMTWRSRLSGIATGDQGIFVQRALFEEAGGFPDIPLMEDIALSRRLRRHGRPACVRQPLLTSGRRWEQHGVLRTILLMWALRLAYFLGADPAALARHYR